MYYCSHCGDKRPTKEVMVDGRGELPEYVQLCKPCRKAYGVD